MDGYVEPMMLIGGEWTRGSGAPDPILDPATEERIGSVPHATDEEIDAALAAAQAGFETWRKLSPNERAKVMLGAADLLRDRSEEIARMLSLEQGKPLGEARIEVVRAASLIEWDANEGRRVYGRILPGDGVANNFVIRQPIGVVAGFSPWNLPVTSATRKIGGALAAGCAIIIKGAEETPASVAALVRCFADSGLPSGVINLLFGHPPQISERLIASPVVRLLTFTGSIPVGKHLAQLCGRHMKPAIMELGGHSPVIVCDDVDIARAAQASAAAKFRNAGQICIAPTRFIVQEDAYDRFVETFVEKAEGLKLGKGLEPGTQMGPLANDRRLAAMEALVTDARSHGATVAAGGERRSNSGYFFAPTVLVDVPAEAKAMNEEPFGPVALISRFSTLDDAIGEANRLSYGLASYAFTNSAETADLLAREVQCGIMTINHFTGVPPEGPFGGVKESGYGREGGSESLESFLVSKFVSHRLAC
ncbi:NAD-dependent succinate-semialdehyde dehydrogenase [Propylenella binzhouense]|uniref:NAD-dependent succinate-semialdehyde dehydrogenase n=1 Tax=Propylenella binzhouense TaxID=2555902 RepID=A0A964T191_9HYPH|nr:NAD-dependent succinate-semialdehyde dehydrogenase [Propylenella binzhouense]MYZ46528.1 NAD-dependent succinate-semialdehyde dehydrogenase [Propylenella binzhouense]